MQRARRACTNYEVRAGSGRRDLCDRAGLVHGARAGEHDGRRGARARRALDDEPAAVQRDEGVHDRQAESGSLVFAREQVLDLRKGLQRNLDLGFVHPNTRIRDRDREPVIALGHAHAHAPVARRELDGV